uniref:Uncharacterized protein n=1 Tax=Tetranychus urticae TaxID=32264 RepID=T1KWQ2_TETUR
MLELNNLKIMRNQDKGYYQIAE